MTELRSLLPKALSRVCKRLECGLPELPSCFISAGDKLKCLKEPGLHLLASRSGMGKSSLAVNLALDTAKQNKSVAFFSLDLSYEQLAEYFFSAEMLVYNRYTLRRDWYRVCSAELDEVLPSLDGLDIHINVSSRLTVSDISSMCRELDNLGLVVIDYMQLLTFPEAKSRQQAVCEMSRALKEMAEELRVPVLCLSRVGRAPESGEDKRPTLSELHEFVAASDEADTLIFLHRKACRSAKNSESDVAECSIVKNRFGESGIEKLLPIPYFRF